MRRIISLCLFATATLFPLSGRADTQAAPALNQDAILALKAQIDAMKGEYEQRIRNLESQLAALQQQMLRSLPEPGAPATPSGQQVAAAPSSPSALNPAITVVGNFLGRADSRKVFNADGIRIDNKMSLREAELDMRAAIDPYADGVFVASIESESPGSYAASVEEAYVTIKKLPFQDRPPLGLQWKVGRFRPAFGANNILHTHDLPQSFRPLPVQEFLGEEGFIQSGISASFYIPTPWDAQSSLDASVQVLTGGEIAIAAPGENRTSYLGHLRWYRAFGAAHSLQAGWSSYVQPSGSRRGTTGLHGVDLMYRWKPLRQGEWKSLVFSGEFMFARRPAVVETSAAGGETAYGRPAGFTAFGQWQFNRRIYAGLRWDQTGVLDRPSWKRRSLTPYVSYYFSEFLRFRINYEQRWSRMLEEDGRRSIFAELNLVFGSHPPEPFWVNK